MGEQSNRLRDFLITVAVDPEAARRYADDPVAEIGRAGLTDEETSLLLSRDSRKLRVAIGGYDPSTESGDRAGMPGRAGKKARKAAKKKGAKKKGGAKKGGRKR